MTPAVQHVGYVYCTTCTIRYSLRDTSGIRLVYVAL